MAEEGTCDPHTQGLEIYRVGGAVRDRLLGLPVEDHDYVVLGTTPQEMERRGFRMVGKDFPVFLHPVTRDEYALARTERKVAPGYRGFAVHADPGVTLRQDLERRDLTINALAEAPDGGVIDYFGGEDDLHNGTLRHVSPAFREDPLRVLRVARYAARFSPLGFGVHPETLALMREIGASGELEALVPERVWQELVRALSAPVPSVFFATLRDAHALGHLLPELDRLWGVPQPANSHPEIGTGIHTMMVLDQAAKLSDEPEVRFAALTHDLGKGETPREAWPHHAGHEERGSDLAASLCRRLKAPRSFRDLAVLSAKYHGRALRAPGKGPEAVLELLERLDAMRRPERYGQFLLVCEADFRGRQGYQDEAHPGVGYLRRAAEVVAAADREGLPKGLANPGEIQRFVRERRLRAIEGLAPPGA